MLTYTAKTRLSAAMKDRLHRYCAITGQTEAVALREILLSALRGEGLWPPTSSSSEAS